MYRFSWFNFSEIPTFFAAFRAVQISKVTVPSYYLENSDSEPLILECDFSIDDKERGFVLKWIHNGVIIYQWIPSRTPFALVSEILVFVFKSPK